MNRRHVFVRDEVRDLIIEECAANLAAWYPDNVSTNAFCAALRSMKSKSPCAHEAIIGLDGCWHCQRCGDAIDCDTPLIGRLRYDVGGICCFCGKVRDGVNHNDC